MYDVCEYFSSVNTNGQTSMSDSAGSVKFSLKNSILSIQIFDMDRIVFYYKKPVRTRCKTRRPPNEILHKFSKETM